MNSWLVWAVVALAVVLLGFVGYHFTVRALRFSAAALAAAVVVLITRYGVMHQAGAPADLVNAFTRGSDDLSAAFLHPLLLGHHVPVPGRAGWLVLAAGLAFGYRELEVWAMRWQPPTLDMSALGSGQPATPRAAASPRRSSALSGRCGRARAGTRFGCGSSPPATTTRAPPAGG